MRVLVCLIIATAGVLPQGRAHEPGEPPPNYWRNPLRCGTNCLYAYMKLHGHPVPLGDIVDAVRIGELGTNMADLRRTASAMGVPSQVIRTTPARLGDVPLPAIAHLQPREGHFTLLLQVTNQTVTTADMLSGSVETMPADRFFGLWSGYLLAPGVPGWDWRLPMSALAALLSTFLAYHFVWARAPDPEAMT